MLEIIDKYVNEMKEQGIEVDKYYIMKIIINDWENAKKHYERIKK